MTARTREQRSKDSRAAAAKRTPEQVAANVKQLTEARVRVWQGLTQEEKDARLSKMQASLKAARAARTSEQIAATSRKQSEARRKGMSEMTPARKAEIGEKISKATRKRMAERTPEQKAETAAKWKASFYGNKGKLSKATLDRSPVGEGAPLREIAGMMQLDERKELKRLQEQVRARGQRIGLDDFG